MFTGIITSMGSFKGYRRGRQEMILEVPDPLTKLEMGTSLAVNGVCLSVARKERATLVFTLSQETLDLTNLGLLRPGCRLNLEPPLTLSSLLSGHLVTGHVDALGKISRIWEKGPGKRLAVSYPNELRHYFISKGSVAVNGVSLTIAKLEGSVFEAELIPLTLENSNIKDLQRGDLVNLECDILGKYVYNWMNLIKK